MAFAFSPFSTGEIGHGDRGERNGVVGAPHTPSVMRGHSRPKDGVLSHAYDPRIHDEVATRPRTYDMFFAWRLIVDCRGQARP